MQWDLNFTYFVRTIQGISKWIQVAKKASFKDKQIMDLIEIVELRNANSRTNGFSERNRERTIYYSTVYSSCTMVIIYLKWQNNHHRYANTMSEYMNILCQRYTKIFAFLILEHSKSNYCLKI